MRSLPRVCPPVVPTVVGAASLVILHALGVLWPALFLGLVLPALAPQWDSCVLGLMDLMWCLLLILTGLFGVVRMVVG